MMMPLTIPALQPRMMDQNLKLRRSAPAPDCAPVYCLSRTARREGMTSTRPKILPPKRDLIQVRRRPGWNGPERQTAPQCALISGYHSAGFSVSSPERKQEMLSRLLAPQSAARLLRPDCCRLLSRPGLHLLRSSRFSAAVWGAPRCSSTYRRMSEVLKL